MSAVVFSPRARQDLIDLWEYIAERNRSAADKLIARIQASISDLAEMPGMGHFRADVKGRRYRFWTVRPCVIAYRFDASTLTVVRVVHGARDFRALFSRT